MKGTDQSVIADNLGARGLAGFIESFSGKYFCRFYVGKRLEIQTESVQTGDFVLRTKKIHDAHVTSAKETQGYLPDIMHDLFEGTVPVELALCLREFVSKKYLSLDTLNSLILNIPYKWVDRTNRPHIIPCTQSEALEVMHMEIGIY